MKSSLSKAPSLPLSFHFDPNLKSFPFLNSSKSPQEKKMQGLVVSGGEDGSLRVWNSETGQQLLQCDKA
jgi:hypothetical protein